MLRVACDRAARAARSKLPLPTPPSRCVHYPPTHQRPILHQRIEAAAREGNIDEVRRLLREHDSAAASLSPPSVGRQLFLAVAAYSFWNFAASAYDYRVAGAEANRLLSDLPEQSVEVEVQVRLKSFSLSAEMTSRRVPEDLSVHPFSESNDSDVQRVRMLPHMFLSDFVFGRSRWVLVCRKRSGRTEWATKSV